MWRIYDENISDVSNEIIGIVDNMFEEYPLPHRIHEMDPSIEELCDAVEYLINSGWLGSTIFAWKMTYTESWDDDIEKTGKAKIIRNNNVNTLTLVTCRHNTNNQIIVICELKEVM